MRWKASLRNGKRGITLNETEGYKNDILLSYSVKKRV